MIGDLQDFVRRLRSVLPRRWLADVAPVSDTVLSAIGAGWVFVFGLIAALQLLTRIRSSSGAILDLISADFFGSALPRRPNEGDQSFIERVEQELFRDRATRKALSDVLWQLTGQDPAIVEPARPADTGSYSVAGCGYGVGGSWGSLALSNCCFVTAFRPRGQGIAQIAGFDTGGPLAYGNLSMVASPVTDGEIFAAAAAVLPLGCTAWLRIKN
jgi:hypothetical protein